MKKLTVQISENFDEITKEEIKTDIFVSHPIGLLHISAIFKI